MSSEALLFPGGVLALSRQAAHRLLSAGEGDPALLYIQLLCQDSMDRQRARKALNWTEDRAYNAWKRLEELKLVDAAAPMADTAPVQSDLPPEYTSADITAEMANESSPFPGLVAGIQRSLGKVLSTADLKTLFTIYDHLALPAEVIFLLVNHCVHETEAKLGAGRRPRMSQIKREAYRWAEAGADTAEAADAYLQKQRSIQQREDQILPLVGIRGRSAVEGEKKYLSAWIDWGFPDESLVLAYERTLLRKGTFNWAYMNSILKNWHAAGLHTLAQIEAGDNRPVPRGNTVPNAPAPASQPAAGRGQDDMERMRRILEAEKRKEENP